LNRALAALPAESRAAPASGVIASAPLGGGAALQLLDLSADLLVAVGGSTEGGESLATLQGGGHDPRARGFTLQNFELSVIGAVDPYFRGEAHAIFFIDPPSGETVVELEEAFLVTTFLPCGFELEVGQMFTEFGRHNPRHPHQWAFLDQPVVNTRLFGPDGMRQVGARLGWLLPTSWFSQVHVGVQNANGETMTSFLSNEEAYEERPVGGRLFVEREVHSLGDLAWLLRWENSFPVARDVTAVVGASGLYGPNATGPRGDTAIWGLDLYLKWRPERHEAGWPFVAWQTEGMGRRFFAESQLDETDPLNPVVVPSDVLEDWGLATQVLYGFERTWIAGLRGEWATGSGASYDVGTGTLVSRHTDPFRDDRLRLSALLVWQPTEFSRLRLQYNFDDASHLPAGTAHSIWLGFEILWGAHPVHTY
jgi:hypothetical protein